MNDDITGHQYESAFTDGELYALKSLTTEWEEYDTVAGKVKAVPLHYIERVAGSIARKRKVLKADTPHD